MTDWLHRALFQSSVIYILGGVVGSQWVDWSYTCSTDWVGIRFFLVWYLVPQVFAKRSFTRVSLWDSLISELFNLAFILRIANVELQNGVSWKDMNNMKFSNCILRQVLVQMKLFRTNVWFTADTIIMSVSIRSPIIVSIMFDDLWSQLKSKCVAKFPFPSPLFVFLFGKQLQHSRGFLKRIE